MTDEVSELRQRAERAEAESVDAQIERAEIERRRIELMVEMLRLRRALLFYARHDNYRQQQQENGANVAPITLDNGQTARAALDGEDK